MNKKNNNSDITKKSEKALLYDELREAAEKKLSDKHPSNILAVPIQEILHELEVHQVELEMQNEELRNSQAIIEESRNRYVDFYDFAPVGYITLDKDGRLEEINLTAATMLGEERNKLFNKIFVHFVSPEDHDTWNRHMMSALKLDKKMTCEIVILSKEGTRLHVQLDSMRLVKDDSSIVIRIAMTDISERIKAEDTLREQEEFFRMITENIDDFIAVLDLEGRRLYNSPSYARLFYNIESMKGTDSFTEVHPDDRERVKHAFNETIKSGTGLQIEYRFVLADGSIRNLESHGELIKDRQGQALRVVVISRDITERKQAEEKILNLAFYDTLTQLPNRRMLDDRIHHAMAASKRSGHYCALMFMDLDNFKPLNDIYGHVIGDMLLIEVAHRISSCVREVDTVARFGGDEFIVMLSELDVNEETSVTQAKIIAEKIRAILSNPYILTIKTKDNKETEIEHHCTASIGLVLFINHELSPSEIIKQADREMYLAKEHGRNQVCFMGNQA